MASYTYYDIIIEPILTEKSMILMEKYNKYTFKVPTNINKKQIKEAVEKIFGVKVKKVNTMNITPKRKRMSYRYREGITPRWKKAIVTLEKGYKIDLVKK